MPVEGCCKNAMNHATIMATDSGFNFWLQIIIWLMSFIGVFQLNSSYSNIRLEESS